MRFAYSFIAVCLWTAPRAFAQVPDAGPDQLVVFPEAATLAASVQGGNALNWWTADGNWPFENYLLRYHDPTGVTPVGPLQTAGGGTFGFPADFVRIGATVYGLDTFRRQIYILDPNTGLVTPIGTMWSTQYSGVESLAYDPAGDRLFAVDQPTGQLLLIQRTSGVPSPVGTRTLAAFAEVRSLAWRASNGRLYAVDQATDALLSIDPGTGLPTILSHVASNPAARIEELDFLNDRLYGVNALQNGTSLVAAQLQRISPGYGLAQNLGPMINQVSPHSMLMNSVPEDRVWSKVSGPGTATFSDAYALNGAVTFSQTGTYVLRLTVTGTSGPVSDTVTIHVLPSAAPGGWTAFTPSPDSRIIYVSSSLGDDANTGFSPSAAKRTIAEGKSLLRHQSPDWLLLKRGDQWEESLGQLTTSGRSPSEPLLISAYGPGTARPLLKTGSTPALWTNAAGGSPASIDDLAIVGLHFHANTYTGMGDCVGGEFLLPGSRLLIEDCKFERYSTNLVLQGSAGRLTNIRLRRSVIVDAFEVHDTGNHPQGLSTDALDGLLVEENVFDHNGWNPAVAGAGADAFSHNIYISNNCSGVVVRGNIISYGSSHGIQLGCGGSVLNNLFLRNGISLLLGGGNSPAASGVIADVRGNVILDGRNVGLFNPRGWGMVFANVAAGLVDSNVIAHNVSGTNPFPLTFDVANGFAGNTRGVENTVFSNNIVHDWNGASQFMGSVAQTVNLQLLGNKFQNGTSTQPLILHQQYSSTNGLISAGNTFDSLASPGAWMRVVAVNKSLVQWKALVDDTTSVSQQLVFPDSNRTTVTYQTWIGGTPTYQAFLDQARSQARLTWRPQYTAGAVNDYVRAGYGFSW